MAHPLDNSPTSSNLHRGIVRPRGGKFSIDNFTSNVSNNLLIPNTYALIIDHPKALQGNPVIGRMKGELAMRIDNIELPGKQLATEEVQYYGPPRKSAYGMIYEDLSFNVYLSKDLKERDYFSTWMDLAFSYNTAHVSYYNDVIGKCTFHSYDRTSSSKVLQSTDKFTSRTFDDLEDKELAHFSKYSVIFEEAYPISIGQVTYAYASSEVAILPVTMAYRKWKKSPPKQN